MNQTQQIYKMQAGICSALAHPIRQHILDLISDREFSCSTLQSVINVSKSTLSQHLSILKQAGIVKTRKEGRAVHVQLAFSQVKDACQLVRNVLLERIKLEEAKLQSLKENL